MTALDISPRLYDRLRVEALRRGTSIEIIAQEVLEAHLPPLDTSPQLRDVLRAAGVLVELAPELAARAAQETATLDEVRAALDRVGGTPLSEVVIAMRGERDEPLLR